MSLRHPVSKTCCLHTMKDRPWDNLKNLYQLSPFHGLDELIFGIGNEISINWSPGKSNSKIIGVKFISTPFMIIKVPCCHKKYKTLNPHKNGTIALWPNTRVVKYKVRFTNAKRVQ